MCSYKTLHHSADGYVIKCNCCNKLQVAFGTTCMSYTEEQYRDYISLVDKYIENNKTAGCRDQKAITLPTVARSISLVYSLNELEKLRSLLIDGRNKLEHEKLFVFNDN
jgi:hypothetical protein